MKKILAIDYGYRHIGLAIASTVLAEPLGTFHYNDDKKALEHLFGLIKKFKVHIIVLGLSENKIAENTKTFAKKISNSFSGEIFFQDETLSSQDAIQKMHASNKPMQKRQKDIHQVSAALILQNFLDEHPNFLLE